MGEEYRPLELELVNRETRSRLFGLVRSEGPETMEWEEIDSELRGIREKLRQALGDIEYEEREETEDGYLSGFFLKSEDPELWAGGTCEPVPDGKPGKGRKVKQGVHLPDPSDFVERASVKAAVHIGSDSAEYKELHSRVEEALKEVPGESRLEKRKLHRHPSSLESAVSGTSLEIGEALKDDYYLD
ncbi:MAG: hypothetical protein ABEK01_01565 [Candidatus Nanohaloarchaea archaeon]